jgi:hypothetical protein
MNISKKLFLIATLGLGMGLQISASEPASTTPLDFADKLDKYSNAEPKNIARWIRETYNHVDPHSTAINEQLKTIISSGDTDIKKTKGIKAIWEQETTPKSNEGYFSNISTLAKAAAAFIVTASIVSYFYFTRR